ncbi:hypothetical protein VEE57_24040 [Escherichia coli]|nr:hypothetical protein VEE57_24040 [Escherichia coli]
MGSLGPGWKMPADIRLQLRDNTLILSDNGGRSLYFEHLFPGEDGYSRSESLWLVRGGVAKLDEGHRLAALWQALPGRTPLKSASLSGDKQSAGAVVAARLV